MRLYSELAGWWHLLSAPHEYKEEAAIYKRLLEGSRDVLELGSGGGNNAWHMKRHTPKTCGRPFRQHSSTPNLAGWRFSYPIVFGNRSTKP